MSAPALLADIGGTNARFALADTAATAPLLDDSVREYEVAQFASLADAARHYLDEVKAKPTHAVMAVAGRVDGDQARITNHPWVISSSGICAALKLERMHLVNDFTAQSMAILALRPQDVVALGGAKWLDGRGERGNDRTFAVIGPGTGLGVGGLLIRNHQPFPLSAEGGHVDFAPVTPEEIGVLQQLTHDFGRVSVERLVSGSGLVNIHRALSRIEGVSPGQLEPEDVTARAAKGDALCMRALDVFCAVFGAAAGNLALTLGAWDGVFLGGGLPPKLLHTLQHSGFRQRFENKGRFASVMAKIPTLVVMHPQPGLLGDAVIAVQDAAQRARA